LSDTTLLGELPARLLATSPWESLAVALGILYLLLAMRESLLCWYAAFFSTSIFLVLFWQANLYMESVLQGFCLVMAVYGWCDWRQGFSAENTLPIARWPLRRHLVAVALVCLLSLASGTALRLYTDAAFPLLDSFTTWGSVLTTWMVARKVLENWLYWLVIDALTAYLYLSRGLHLTSLLFASYCVIVIFGYRTWLQHYRRQQG